MFKPLEYAYFLTAVIELYAEVSQNSTVRYISKPLLMIILMLFYSTNIIGGINKFHKLMIAAFFFSWIGDVALMFVGQNENFFLVGLVGFLITHVLYAVAFAKVTLPKKKALLPQRIWVVIPLLIYMAALLSILIPAINSDDKTKPFLVPVLVYSTAIATMVLFSINRYRRVSDQSFALVFAGALLFMVSDSIIATGKFIIKAQPGSTEGIASALAIMVLYIGGQYLIAKGCLRQINPPEWK